MICFTTKKTFDTRLDIRGSNSNIFKNESPQHEDLSTATSKGVPEWLVFSIFSVILTTTRTMVSGC